MTRRKRRVSRKYRAIRTLAWPLNAATAVLDMLLSLPILGRLIKWVWNILITAGHFLVGVVEFGLMKLGFMPEKKLQVGFVILRDEKSQPLTNAEALIPAIQEAIDIFYEQAKVRVIPIGPTSYEVDETGSAIPDESWVKINPKPGTAAMLDVHCNVTAMGEDLWLTGMRYQFMHAQEFFQNSLRRLTGYGAPVTTIIVRKIHQHSGCSLGMLADYITLAYNAPACLAHELGHACNLLHRKDQSNLMFPNCKSRELTTWQIAVVRASRHVTYF